ncbi:MAG: LdpA C-terminal domain-containing domain [Prochloraceae cyanobacterium]|nr:LdpA C-terminal domain-containing domain [Prochloraceae cyanobacterium]
MRKQQCPLNSLREGNWFKLICGASFQHLPAIRSLALVYALAGADCIDVAADRAVITAVKEALTTAKKLAETKNTGEFNWQGLPWLMVSLNDGEDPHFRKAEFEAQKCPANCSAPCEKICPAGAIKTNFTGENFSGIIADRCYGCGRCLPVCPVQIIETRSYVSKKEAIVPLIAQNQIDAIEIHTRVGNREGFKNLWEAIAPVSDRLKLLSISCGDDPNLIEYLKSLYEIINPISIPLIWQTDGRPMSGDLGIGTTRASVRLAQKVLAAGLPGYVQLAGGTNHHTTVRLRAAGMLNDGDRLDKPKHPFVSGVAYGSYARSLLSPILEKLERVDGENLNAQIQAIRGLEDCQDLLSSALQLAYSLVSQLKNNAKSCFLPEDSGTTQLINSD